MKFSVTDADGKVLVGPDNRELEFVGDNAFATAKQAARPRYRRGKLISGATTDGKTPYRGRTFIRASAPLEPSGISRWELHTDGSTIEVE